MVANIEQRLSNPLWNYEQFLIMQLWKPFVLVFFVIIILSFMKWDMWWSRAFSVSFYESEPSLTIAPKVWENHRKTINVNGQSKEKHSMVMVQWHVAARPLKNQEKNHYHRIILKELPSLKSHIIARPTPWVFFISGQGLFSSSLTAFQNGRLK